MNQSPFFFCLILFIFPMPLTKGLELLTPLVFSLANLMTSSPCIERFVLDKLIWKSISPSKVKAFVWTTVLNWINTNDMLQKYKPLIVLSPSMYIMCGLNSKSGAHIFLHCLMWDLFGAGIFSIFEESRFCPIGLYQFLLTKFRGFGQCKEAKIRWQPSIFIVLWYIWLDKNSRVFNDSLSTLDFI